MDLDLFFPRRQYSDPWGRRWSSLMSDPFEDVLALALPRDAIQRAVDRRRRDETSGELANDPNKFQVKLDCSHFKPEEIEVKTIDNNIVIHGKHSEKMDKHGWVEREFTRRYALPEDCEAKQVKSSFTGNGVLTIEAPKRRPEAIGQNERVVPIRVVHESANTEDQKQIQN